MKESKFFGWISLISGLITICDFIFRTLKKSKITLSSLSIVCFCIFIVALVLYFAFKDREIGYKIRKIISYYFRSKDSYIIKNKECVYIFKTRTQMEYIKKHEIISNVNNLNQFCDKFKWSKEVKLDDIRINCEDKSHKLNVRRIENWNQYTVEFDGIGKGQKQYICIRIDNLFDPQKEALSFLSSNVVCKTQRLKLAIVFNDKNLEPINIKYKIFDNYASDFPLIQRDLTFDKSERKIEIVEKKPIYGYRYVVTWDFNEDTSD